jgi:hypothetical protein
MLYLLLTGCSQYAFNKSDEHPGTDTSSSGLFPSGDDSEEPEDSPPESKESQPNESQPGEDTCYEPEDGYTQNPAARIFTTDGSTAVTVTFVGSDTGYQDTLVLDAPESRHLVNAWSDAIGTVLSLGPYGTDTELIFGIDVTNTGDHWQSGPSSRNWDGVTHVAVTYEGNCSWLIGFEDLAGGGDLDFNDVILRVQGMLKQDQ